MRKFTLTIVTVIYILLVIAIVSVLTSEFLFKEKPKERFFEVPQIKIPILENITSEIKKEEPKFIPAPKTELKYIKGLIINPYVKNSDYIAAIKDAKALGANLITIALDMEVNEFGGVEFPGKPRFDWKPVTISMINEAHKQGLQVELRTVAVPDTRYPRNSTGYIEQTGKFFVELGDFAQEHQVYMLTIFENIEDDRNLGLYKNKINPALRSFLTNVTKFYKGEVGVGFSDTSLLDQKIVYDVSYYDYLILNSYPIYNKVPWGDLPLRVNELVDVGKRYKQSQGLKRLILGGFGVNSDKSPTYYIPITTTQENEKIVYEIIFEKQTNRTDGFTVAYVTKVYGVKGKQAESVVKDWYAKI